MLNSETGIQLYNYTTMDYQDRDYYTTITIHDSMFMIPVGD